MFGNRQKDNPKVIAERIARALTAMIQSVSALETELGAIESSRAAVIKRYVASLEHAKSVMLGDNDGH
jgi:hypothetical protein